jgi:hypothetical protein
MLGEASDFTPLDLLAVLGTNALVTNQACKTTSLRVGMPDKTGEVPVWGDFRLLGGIASGVVAQFGGPAVRRAGYDIATGLLGSYVATETCRRHAMARAQESAAQPAGALPGATAPAAAPAGAPTGDKTGAYGNGW